MIRINLLPFRAARKRENIKRQLTTFGLTILLLIIMMGYEFLSLNSTLASLNRKRTGIKKELAEYKSTINKINRLQKRINAIKKKLGIIKTLERGKSGPVHLLDEISKAVPKDRLWIDSLQESKGRLALRGIAKDYSTVARFMVNLKKSKYIRSVTLGSTQLKTIKGRKLSKFNLNCVISYKTKAKAKVRKKKPKKRK